MKLFILPILACGLWAQDAGKVIPPSQSEIAVEQVAVLKARIAWLEQMLAMTQAKMAGLMQFYSANEQLQGLAAKEPKPEKPAQ